MDDNVDNDVSIYRVRELVTNRCAPELEETYVQLNNILVKCNYPVHLDELDLLWSMMESQSIDVLTLVDNVDTVMRIAVNRALENIGVVFNDEIRLPMLVEAADSLLLFDPTDNPELLSSVLADTEDEIDAVCKLMVFFGTFEYEQWLEVVEDVSDNFTRNVSKIAEQAQRYVAAREDAPEGKDQFFKRVGQLVKEHPDSLGAELASGGIGLGASLESLYGCHVGRMLEYSEEKAVNELFSLAAISSESFESAVTVVGACLDDLFIDVYQRAKAERIVGTVRDTFKPLFGDRS